jgi:hypothetical protein
MVESRDPLATAMAPLEVCPGDRERCVNGARRSTPSSGRRKDGIILSANGGGWLQMSSGPDPQKAYP